MFLALTRRRRNHTVKRKKRLLYGFAVVGVMALLFFSGIWLAGNQLLFPSWKGATKDLAFI